MDSPWIEQLKQALEQVAPIRLAYLFGSALLLNGAPLPMQFAVVRTGSLLLARSEIERIRYEAWVASAYLDFAPTLRLFEESLLARIR